MPQWCDKHKQHTIDENCAGCVQEGETAASLRAQLQAAEQERDARDARWYRSIELVRKDGESQIDELERELEAVEQKRDELAQIAARVVIVPCKRCGAEWPHFSILSDSPVCATCRRAVEQERDALLAELTLVQGEAAELDTRLTASQQKLESERLSNDVYAKRIEALQQELDMVRECYEDMTRDFWDSMAASSVASVPKPKPKPPRFSTRADRSPDWHPSIDGPRQDDVPTAPPMTNQTPETLVELLRAYADSLMDCGDYRGQYDDVSDLIREAADALSASGPEGAEREWATASEFIREMIEAVGFEQPEPHAVISLADLRLQVVGLIEDLKAQVAEAETKGFVVGKRPEEAAPVPYAEQPSKSRGSVEDEARRLLAKITPDPWAWEWIAEKSNEWAVGQAFREDGTQVDGRIGDGEWLEDTIIERRLVGMNESGHARVADAEFIAAAPRIIRALLAEREAASAVRAACEFGDCKDHYSDPAAWCVRCQATQEGSPR